MKSPKQFMIHTSIINLNNLKNTMIFVKIETGFQKLLTSDFALLPLVYKKLIKQNIRQYQI